jgi:SP family facilitated glucose transporter-like MFS transporter 2
MLCVDICFIALQIFILFSGPIPFVYVAECFRSQARSTALAVAVFTNWMANLLLTLTFPYMADSLGDYTFLVFTGVVLLALCVIITKVKLF